MIMIGLLELNLLQVFVSKAPEEEIGDLVLHVVLVSEQAAPEAEFVKERSPCERK